jgi:predicted transcriptional regulator
MADIDRDRSAALFNNCHLVEIVIVIAAYGRKPFTTRQISTSTGLADSIVRPVIRRLLDAGLVERTTSTTHGRGRAPNYLRVTSMPGWAELKALCRKLNN